MTSATCSSGGSFGSIDLGASGYVNFNDASFTSSTVTWNASTFTLTITLGTVGGSGTVATDTSSHTATYTAGSGFTDRAGNTVNGTGSSTSTHF